MHLKRLKYTMLVMMLITSMVAYAAITTGNTLAVLIDRSASLVNTFISGEITASTELDINIQKKVMVGDLAILNAGGFTFELTDLQNNEVIKAVSDANGKAAFTLAFSEEDIGNTYHYTLHELNDGREGYTYSTQVYEISVTVLLKGNDLIAELTVDGQPMDALTAEFINHYTSEDGAPPPPAGDNSHPVLYGMMVIISAAGLYLFFNKQRKHS